MAVVSTTACVCVVDSDDISSSELRSELPPCWWVTFAQLSCVLLGQYDVAFVPVVSKPIVPQQPLARGQPEPEAEKPPAEASTGGGLCFVIEVSVRQPDALHRAPASSP